jgi:hypothetical protein
MFDRIKKLFTDYRKHIKFYAILFLIIVIIYIAVSPNSPNSAVTQAGTLSGGSKMVKHLVKSAAKKCVCFPLNPVTHVWTK